MMHRYSLWMKVIYAIILLILLCSAVTPLPIQGVVAAPQEQEAQTTPAASVDVPVVAETQIAVPSETPVITETQVAPPTETPVVLETKTVEVPVEIPELLETQNEAPPRPTISREMPTQPALQQPERNSLPPQTNTLPLAGEVQAKAIAAGGGHTCALTTGGGVKCWGYNVYGQLGNNSTTYSSVPVNVYGLSSGVQAIAAGGGHTCALTTGGGVKCWGYNGYGQLGRNSTTNSLVPVSVLALASGVQAITAGDFHTCALTTAGKVKCWGYNLNGQLGNNATTDSPVVVDVYGLTTGIKAIAAGYRHTCALTIGGGVKCWGDNYYGQLGNDGNTRSPVPVNVYGLSGGVQAIATGYGHTCALTTGGRVKCWGYNGEGELGNNDTSKSRVPVDVNKLTSGVYAIAAGSGHTCALTAVGGLKCWGDNSDGQLGNNTITNSRIPVNVAGFYELPPGFNSQFNGNATGWTKIYGTWGVNSLFYSVTGSPVDHWVSSRYNIVYINIDFQSRMYRPSAANTRPNALIVRGSTFPLSGNHDWYKGYWFQYMNEGMYSVWRINNNTTTALKDWTVSPYIVKGGWNTLRVRAVGSQFWFYINGHFVWTGTDSSFPRGYVGLGKYNYPSTSTVYFDWATLTVLSTSLIPAGTETISPEQIRYNDAATSNPSGLDFTGRREKLRSPSRQ